MRSSSYRTGPVSDHRRHFTSTGFIAAIVGRWREYRMMRDIESLPYAVMKDIGFRAAERANAK
ncbi:MAG: hypothetical protein KL863_24245 [Rhizobium sp.]|nr:hypothetical protein [Rhizobium sp.]